MQTTLPPQSRRVLNAAMEAGHILLQNGAEIARVEETMEKICAHYGVDTGEFFVLSNGIFTTAGYTADQTYARVKHIPVKGARLDKVVAVNQLSREIVGGRYPDIAAVEKRLKEIDAMPTYSLWTKVLASGVGSGFFCVLAGGGMAECVAAFLAGLLLFIYVLKISAPHMSKIVGNIIGGMLVVLISLACRGAWSSLNLSAMISGTIMPLVPGVAFTNGIRDIANGDYISGIVRMLDAILVFLCIAIGVGVMFTIYHALTGGIMP